MRKIYSKNKKKFRWGVFFIFISCILLITFFVLSSVTRIFSKKDELEQNVSQIEDEIYSLENTNEELRRLIEYLKTPDYARAQARGKLGMHLPGEEVFVITDVAVPASGTGVDAGGEEEWDVGNPTRWWRYFFHEE